MSNIQKIVIENWEIITAFSALLLSLTGILLSIYEGRANRKHNKLSIMPKLVFDIPWPEKMGTFDIYLVNHGLGPALIKDIWFINKTNQTKLKPHEMTKFINNKIIENFNANYTIIGKNEAFKADYSLRVFQFTKYGEGQERSDFMKIMKDFVLQVEYSDFYGNKMEPYTFDFLELQNDEN